MQETRRVEVRERLRPRVPFGRRFVLRLDGTGALVMLMDRYDGLARPLGPASAIALDNTDRAKAVRWGCR